MFTRVDPKIAGPTALGILIPPGTKSLVILRPRSLPYDLLPARWDGDGNQAPQFCTFTRDEAVLLARRLMAALEQSVQARSCPVETFGAADGTSVQIWLRCCDLVWICCTREPGSSYRPMIFPSATKAIQEAERLAAVVWPEAGASQEYYFNTQALS